MNKKIWIFLFVTALVFGISILAFAKEAANTTTQVVAKESVNVGNKICPVSGEKIDEAKKAIYEYEGKIYNFCCPMCLADFKKDPQKYIKKVEDELKGAVKEEKQEMEMTEGQEMPMPQDEGHQH